MNTRMFEVFHLLGEHAYTTIQSWSSCQSAADLVKRFRCSSEVRISNDCALLGPVSFFEIGECFKDLVH